MAAVFAALGPVEHFVRPYSGGTWLYLGTAVTSPEEDAEDFLLPVLNDLGGRQVPMDYVRDRRKAMVTTTVGRLNRSTYRTLRGETSVAANASSYVEGANLNGSLTIALSSFQLLLVNSFVASGINIPSADQPVGRCYYSAIPRRFNERREGSRVVEASVLFECISPFTANNRAFSLYTEDPNFWGTVTPE